MARIAELREWVEDSRRSGTLELPYDTALELLTEIEALKQACPEP